MSRIGKKPVSVPSGVTATVAGQVIKMKGPKGELSFSAPEDVKVEMKDGSISVTPVGDSKKARSMWGMSRTQIANLIKGVTDGYSRTLEIQGVGYRAAAKGRDLELALGYSHPVSITAPEGSEFDVPQPTEVVVRGIDKQKVGQIAANIRESRPPEPYKGKGIRYRGEHVVRKVGKRV